MEAFDFADETPTLQLAAGVGQAVADVVSPGGMRMRGYQLDAVRAANEAWAAGKRSLLGVMATGLGKTVVFCSLITQAVAEGGKCLVLAHTDELLTQAADKLEQISGLRAAREKAKDRASLFDQVVVSSIQTLGRGPRLKSWDPNHFSLVVVDEAHRSLAKSYDTILSHFAGAKVLGLTATPDRGDEQSLGQIFQDCVFNYGILEGVRDGWLVRPVAKTIPLKVDIRGIKVRKGADGNDLDPAEISRRLEPFLVEIAAQLIAHAGVRKTVIFLPSVDTAMRLAQKLASLGARADFVAGDRERCPDRHERIARFRAGETQFMACALLLTEGFDDPEISCICCLRPTKIRSLFVQMCGRGTRPLPGLVDSLEDSAGARLAAIAASRKPDCLLLDPLWLTERIDLVKPVHLVTGKVEVANRMMLAEGEQKDLVALEKEANRDLLLSLAEAVHKNKNKKGRVFDPLARAIMSDEEDLKNYQPSNFFERLPPTAEQIAILKKAKIDLAKVTSQGLAGKIIGQLDRRSQAGLLTLGQQMLFEQMKVSNAAQMTREQANQRMRHIIKRKWRRT